jgi:hypothetical protein
VYLADVVQLTETVSVPTDVAVQYQIWTEAVFVTVLPACFQLTKAPHLESEIENEETDTDVPKAATMRSPEVTELLNDALPDVTAVVEEPYVPLTALAEWTVGMKNRDTSSNTKSRIASGVTGAISVT